MDKINLYIEEIITVITLFITTVSFLIKSVKSSKAQKNAKAEIQLNDILLKLMEEVEKYVNYSGEEKKAYVITRVKEEFLSNKIKLDAVKVNDKIESLIQLSKNVNSRSNNDKTLKKLNVGGNHDQ